VICSASSPSKEQDGSELSSSEDNPFSLSMFDEAEKSEGRSG
jgi:hypothetical protein